LRSFPPEKGRKLSSPLFSARFLSAGIACVSAGFPSFFSRNAPPFFLNPQELMGALPSFYAALHEWKISFLFFILSIPRERMKIRWSFFPLLFFSFGGAQMRRVNALFFFFFFPSPLGWLSSIGGGHGTPFFAFPTSHEAGVRLLFFPFSFLFLLNSYFPQQIRVLFFFQRNVIIKRLRSLSIPPPQDPLFPLDRG